MLRLFMCEILNIRVFIFFIVIKSIQCLPQRNRNQNLTIFNGEEVKPHSIPFQAWLTFYDDFGFEYCGGSLISENFILTAAHCIEGNINVTILLGAHNRSADENEFIQVFYSTQLFAHENFGIVGQTVVNDIGLVKLPQPVKLTSSVQLGPIISQEEYEANKDLSGVNATVSGWGKIGDTKIYSDVLRAGTLSIISQTLCQESSPVFTKDQFLCVALHPHSTESASGDSGGPLVDNQSGKIVGLVSLGDENFEIDTNVGYYLGWIANYTNVI